MQIIIQLKDGFVTKIETDSEYEKERDYYGYTVHLFDNIYIYFTSNTGVGYRTHLYAKNVELTDFLSFFYDADFSNMNMEDFKNALIEHLGGFNQYNVITTSDSRYARQDKQ